jgi:hypothetical protein
VGHRPDRRAGLRPYLAGALPSRRGSCAVASAWPLERPGPGLAGRGARPAARSGRHVRQLHRPGRRPGRWDRRGAAAPARETGRAPAGARQASQACRRGLGQRSRAAAPHRGGARAGPGDPGPHPRPHGSVVGRRGLPFGAGVRAHWQLQDLGPGHPWGAGMVRPPGGDQRQAGPAAGHPGPSGAAGPGSGDRPLGRLRRPGRQMVAAGLVFDLAGRPADGRHAGQRDRADPHRGAAPRAPVLEDHGHQVPRPHAVRRRHQGPGHGRGAALAGQP